MREEAFTATCTRMKLGKRSLLCEYKKQATLWGKAEIQKLQNASDYLLGLAVLQVELSKARKTYFSPEEEK